MTATASCHTIRLLSLPPPYRLVISDRLGSSFRDTCRCAEKLRAGAFVWVPQPDLIEFAVVLEPEVPLNTARWALFCGMTALADTILRFVHLRRASAWSGPTRSILTTSNSAVGV